MPSEMPRSLGRCAGQDDFELDAEMSRRLGWFAGQENEPSVETRIHHTSFRCSCILYVSRQPSAMEAKGQNDTGGLMIYHYYLLHAGFCSSHFTWRILHDNVSAYSGAL